MSSLRTFSRQLRTHLLALAAFLFLLSIPFVHAQMPGMNPDSETPAPPQAPAHVIDQDLGLVTRYYQQYLGEQSPYRPVILTILTLLILLKLKGSLTKIIKTKVEANAYKKENAAAFLVVWHRTWKFIIFVLVIIAMSGSLKLLGLTAGFLGMMLGWSLQQPVTGIAAWLMIVTKKPFQIGDRVVIAGVTGDVTGISLTHVVLNQVGGSIGGEERSGRGILIPNAILFQHIITNYTLEQNFMLDEVPIRLTFDSDYDLARQIMIKAATTVTDEMVHDTGTEPFTRVEFLDWGLLVRLRYNTIPSKRQEISSRIIEILLKEFRKEFPKVRFAIPSSRVRYQVESEDPDFPVLPPAEPKP